MLPLISFAITPITPLMIDTSADDAAADDAAITLMLRY